MDTKVNKIKKVCKACSKGELKLVIKPGKLMTNGVSQCSACYSVAMLPAYTHTHVHTRT
jgi:hypothetical protein